MTRSSHQSRELGPPASRLCEIASLTPDEARLASALQAEKRRQPPALSQATLARIGKAVGEPPRRPAPAVWRTAAACAAVLLTIGAIALAVRHSWTADPAASGAPRSTLPTLVQSNAPPDTPPDPKGVPTPAPASEAPSAPVSRTREQRTTKSHPTSHRREATEDSAAVAPVAGPPVQNPEPPAMASAAGAPELGPALRDALAALSPTVATPPRGSRLGTQTAPAPGVPDTFDAEAAQLRRGLTFKQAGDLERADAAFESYLATYPRGYFWGEAALAQLDVQLALGRPQRALDLVERVRERRDVPRAEELQLLRGELLTKLGRPGEALAVFGGSWNTPALAGRALFGRASCLQALGRLDESRRDLEQYLARYPNGPFASSVRAGLCKVSTGSSTSECPAH